MVCGETGKVTNEWIDAASFDSATMQRAQAMLTFKTMLNCSCTRIPQCVHMDMVVDK
jgi:hypothetical protein